MNVWAITWRWADHSESGVFPRVYTEVAMAEHVLDILQAEGNKVYEVLMLEVVDTLGVLPKPLLQTPSITVYQRSPHEGVKGGTPFDNNALTVRLENLLKLEDIMTHEQVVCWQEWELIRIPGMGRKSLNELREYLHSKGLKLKGQA